MSGRLSWDEYFIQMATLASTRSPCERLHVGCILTKDNRVISQAYNGYLPGCPHEQKIIFGPDNEKHEMATVHAEQNAITDCAKRGVSCAGATAYITHYPCINCMKMLCAAGIKNIKYTNDYHNDPLVPYFTKVSGVLVEKTNTKQETVSLRHVSGFIVDDEITSPPCLFVSSSESSELHCDTHVCDIGDIVPIPPSWPPAAPRSRNTFWSEPIFVMPSKT